MTQIGDRIEKVRAILKQYDNGESSAMWCEADLFHLFMDPFLAAVEKPGDGYMTFGSCCCSSHPPDRTFKVEITIQPHGFTAKRCE